MAAKRRSHPAARAARLLAACGCVVAALAPTAEAKGQTTTHSLAATDYLRDYNDHAHGYMETVALVPRFTDASPWARFREVLMPRRKTQALYLVGDDRMHLFPTRVGVLGWGMTAAVRF